MRVQKAGLHAWTDRAPPAGAASPAQACGFWQHAQAAEVPGATSRRTSCVGSCSRAPAGISTLSLDLQSAGWLLVRARRQQLRQDGLVVGRAHGDVQGEHPVQRAGRQGQLLRARAGAWGGSDNRGQRAQRQHCGTMGSCVSSCCDAGLCENSDSPHRLPAARGAVPAAPGCLELAAVAVPECGSVCTQDVYQHYSI